MTCFYDNNPVLVVYLVGTGKECNAQGEELRHDWVKQKRTWAENFLCYEDITYDGSTLPFPISSLIHLSLLLWFYFLISAKNKENKER